MWLLDLPFRKDLNLSESQFPHFPDGDKSYPERWLLVLHEMVYIILPNLSESQFPHFADGNTSYPERWLLVLHEMVQRTLPDSIGNFQDPVPIRAIRLLVPQTCIELWQWCSCCCGKQRPSSYQRTESSLRRILHSRGRGGGWGQEDALNTYAHMRIPCQVGESAMKEKGSEVRTPDRGAGGQT